MIELPPMRFQDMRYRGTVGPRQPMYGIGSLADRARSFGRFQPQYPFGGGGFPGMQRGFPGGGGGFFLGGFRPRLRRRRRPPPQMPDYSSQFSSLEAKIAELQKQLAESQAARQAATPMPDPVMDIAEPLNIPQIDPVALKELQDRIAGASAPAAPPVSVPNVGPINLPNLDLAELGMEGGNVGALPRRGGILSREDVGGRKMIKPPSIERIMPPMPKKIPTPTPVASPRDEGVDQYRQKMLTDVPDVMFPMPIRVPEPMPEPVMPAPMPVMPAPVMPKKIPMPSLPKFPMPQIDPIGRVAAPLTRGPVNAAINMPMVGMRGPRGRMS